MRVSNDHRHLLPDHRTLQAALTEMRFPGMLCVAMPVSTGLVFRWVGSMTGRPMLGAEARPDTFVFFRLGRRSDSDGRVRSLSVFASVCLFYGSASCLLGGPFTCDFHVFACIRLEFACCCRQAVSPLDGVPACLAPAPGFNFLSGGFVPTGVGGVSHVRNRERHHDGAVLGQRRRGLG